MMEIEIHTQVHLSFYTIVVEGIMSFFRSTYSYKFCLAETILLGDTHSYGTEFRFNGILALQRVFKVNSALQS